ncbi:MAG TPA: hypothetical protein VMS35_02090 [Nitrososphaeraceae archaeon]|nr:hypothetical protein [Nitrososphaeraceae archaeon]
MNINISDVINGHEPNRKQRRYRNKIDDKPKLKIIRKADPTTLAYIEFLNKSNVLGDTVEQNYPNIKKAATFELGNHDVE